MLGIFMQHFRPHEKGVIYQWLNGCIGGVYIHAANNIPIIYACSEGHLSVAQWLYGLALFSVFPCMLSWPYTGCSMVVWSRRNRYS
jgi:hypothetical protein